MTSNNDYPYVPLDFKFNENGGPPNGLRSSKTIIQIMNRTINGKTNNCGSFTCTHGAASTVVNEPLCNVNSVILCQPFTADAAAEIAAGSFYIVAGDKSFTVHHVNGASTDRNFNYIVVG